MSITAEDQAEPAAGTAALSGEPVAPLRTARARSRSASNSSTGHKGPRKSSSFSSAQYDNLGGSNSKGASEETVPHERDEEEKEEEEVRGVEGGGGDGGRGEQRAERREGDAANAETGPETETEDLVAVEADKWVGGVAVDRIRSRSSMYRSEEGSQSYLHNPRSRAASSTVAKTASGTEIGVEGGKEVPPELVVSEDQEVS